MPGLGSRPGGAMKIPGRFLAASWPAPHQDYCAASISRRRVFSLLAGLLAPATRVAPCACDQRTTRAKVLKSHFIRKLYYL